MKTIGLIAGGILMSIGLEKDLLHTALIVVGAAIIAACIAALTEAKS